MDQPGKAANPAHSQLLNRKYVYIPLSAYSRLTIWSREMCSAVPSRVSLFVSILRLNLVLTYGIPPDTAAASIYLFMTATRLRNAWWCSFRK